MLKKVELNRGTIVILFEPEKLSCDLVWDWC